MKDLYDKVQRSPPQGQVCIGQGKWVCLHCKLLMTLKNRLNGHRKKFPEGPWRLYPSYAEVNRELKKKAFHVCHH